MNHLVASILVLLIGPALYRLFRRYEQMLAALDGFNFVAIAGLIFLSILPESLNAGGPWVLLLVGAGLLVPTWMERHFRRAGRETHFIALVLAMAGLCVHAAVDGAALVHGLNTASLHGLEGGELGHHVHHDGHLPFAIILHRVPIGLTIWLLLRPRYGRGWASATLSLVAAGTAAGFYVGTQIFDRLPPVTMACFEALVAGSLMHVVLHRLHGTKDSACDHAPARHSVAAGVGGVLGLAMLGVLLGRSALLLSSDLGSEMAETFVHLALESAPALLLGYALAGLLRSFLPRGSIAWMRRGGAFGQSLRGMAFGLPLPVCSCGVVPLYRTLVQRGAPATAAMAFMVATPELGIDAVLLSVPLLGVEMTIARVVAAALVALLVGWIVGLVVRNATAAGVVANRDDASTPRPVLARLREAAGFGLGELVDHTAPWILVGLGVAALVEPLLDADWLTWLPMPLSVLAFAAIGVPTYVCASGATPLVAVLLLKGVSPGAALAFLLTGPATNITTFGVLGKLHGRRAALIFSTTIVALSVGLGLALNWCFPALESTGAAAAEYHPHGPLAIICLVALSLVVLASFVRRGPRRFMGEVLQTGSGDGDDLDGPPTAPCDSADSAHHHGHDHAHAADEGRRAGSDCCG